MKKSYFILCCFLLLYGTYCIGQNSSIKTDPNYFPIAVWVQNPANALAYKDNGINMYVALNRGLDQTQLDLLKNAQMKVICRQNAFGLDHVTDPVIYGWMHGDEPDNAQMNRTTNKYDPCIDPAIIIKSYEDIKKKDSSHPVYLNLSQGVAWANWYGRGTCTGNTDMYKISNNGYLKGSDLASFDIYPVNNTDTATHNNLWYVAKGIENLIAWSDNSKPAWCWIETTKIHDTKNSRKPTTVEVKSEVWMALIHGAKGFGYFCHSFVAPQDEAALLHDEIMIKAVKAINTQVNLLAPVLNSVNTAGYATVSSTNTSVPVDIMTKNYGNANYIFAVGMRSGFTTVAFNVTSGTRVEVLGENRTINISGGKFMDEFSPYGVHLYKVTN